MIAWVGRRLGLEGPGRYVFAGRIFGLVAGIITAVVASRALGASGRGTVVGFSVIQFLLSTGLALGTGSAAYVVASRRALEPGLIAGALLVWAAGLGAAATLLTMTALAFGLLHDVLHGLPDIAALLIGPAAAGQYIVVTMVQLAMGRGRQGATMLGLVFGPLLLLLMTLAVAAIGATPPFMVAAYTVAWLIAAVLAVVVVSPQPSVKFSSVWQLVRVGSPAALGDVANALSYRADVIVLGTIAGTSAVGVYALAVQAMEPLWLLAGSAAGGLLITLPRQSRVTWHAATLRNTVPVVAWTGVGLAGVLGVMPLLAGIAGPTFSRAPAVALALAPAILLLTVSKMLAVVQLTGGRLWWGTVISWSAFVVNVAACLALVPPLGATGAALASGVSYGLSAVLWMFAFVRPSARTGISRHLDERWDDQREMW